MFIGDEFFNYLLIFDWSLSPKLRSLLVHTERDASLNQSTPASSLRMFRLTEIELGELKKIGNDMAELLRRESGRTLL